MMRLLLRLWCGVLLGCVACFGMLQSGAHAVSPPMITSFAPSRGAVGTSVAIYGEGTIGVSAVMFNGIPAASFSLDNAGVLHAIVPWNAITGPITMVNPVGTATSATNFTVTLGIKVSASVGVPSSTVTVSGTQFGAGETVQALFDSTVLTTTAANANGGFTTTIKIPATALPGAHVIEALGATSGKHVQKAYRVRTSWSQFADGASHTGNSAYASTITADNVANLQEKWRFDIYSHVTESAAIINDTMYFGGDGYLYAVDANTGVLRWESSSAVGIDASAPAIANNTVFLGTDGGTLIAYNASGCGSLHCAPRWTSTVLSGQIMTAPAAANKLIYVTSAAGDLYAFSDAGCGSATCAPLWSANFGGSASAPAEVNGILYVGSDDAKLYAFKATGCGSTTCNPLWTSTPTESAIDSSPAVANGVVYITSDDGSLYAYAAKGCGSATRDPLWSAAGNFFHQSPAVANGVVYVGSNDFKLYAFSANGCGVATCAPLWTSTAVGDSMSLSPTIVQGVVYVTDHNGAIYAYNAAGCGGATCGALWSFTAKASMYFAPIQANGMLYVASSDGVMYAFGL